MDSKEELERQRWVDDPRNEIYWSPNKSTVIRAWPINSSQIELYDCVSNRIWTVNNVDVTLMIRDGELVVINPFEPKVLPSGGRTPARLTNPDKETSLIGKYAAPSSDLKGKYANMGVMKRAIQEKFPINSFPPALSVKSSDEVQTFAGGDTESVSPSSPDFSRDAESGTPTAPLRQTLAGKYGPKP